MPETEHGASAVLSTERVLAFPPARVFAAFESPDQLARWWGPAGFTNTFERFEFRPGGRWVYVMNGPDRGRFPNESVFQEIVPDERVVIEHVVTPWYRLTVTLGPHGGGTRVTWDQEFQDPRAAGKMRRIVGPANEENLDRLEALLGGGDPAGVPARPRA